MDKIQSLYDYWIQFISIILGTNAPHILYAISFLLFIVLFFGVGFITMILNQMSTASHIILDMYNSSDLLVNWVSKIAIIFSHLFMFTLSSIYIIYFILLKQFIHKK